MFILCLKIFFVRILDVSLGTIRTMFVVRGKKLISSIIGFFEILVWFLVVKEALQTESNSIFIAISYSLGFATGNYIGALLSDKLITGNVSVQVFTNNNNLEKINPYKNAIYINNTSEKYIKIVNNKGKTIKKIDDVTINKVAENGSSNVVIIVKNSKNKYGLLIGE